MTIPELITNLGSPEWVALHLFGAIEALDSHLGLTPRMKRWVAFLGALGAPLAGYALKVSTKVEVFDLNAFLVVAVGAWAISTQVLHRVWERLEDRAVSRAVQITTVLPDMQSMGTPFNAPATMNTPPINLGNVDRPHIIQTPRVGGGGGAD